jgi:hypothetical protein
MSIQVILTEKEVLDTPNYYELGRIATNRYWQERRNQEGPQFDDEHFSLSINEDGTVTSINRPWTCSICGESTEEIEYDYLVGYDHLGCVLKQEDEPNQHDKCVICGKETPYLKSTHIDYRIGYVEGGGQGCYQPNICEK